MAWFFTCCFQIHCLWIILCLVCCLCNVYNLLIKTLEHNVMVCMNGFTVICSALTPSIAWQLRACITLPIACPLHNHCYAPLIGMLNCVFLWYLSFSFYRLTPFCYSGNPPGRQTWLCPLCPDTGVFWEGCVHMGMDTGVFWLWNNKNRGLFYCQK